MTTIAVSFDQAFLSCDWGTSQFRLRLVRGANDEIVAELSTEDGVGRLAAGFEGRARTEEFRSRLSANLTALDREAAVPDDCPIVVSGMASSTIGWCELPYARLPFPLDASGLVWKELEPLNLKHRTHRVFLLSGVRGEWEIMRGEETQLLGLARLSEGTGLQAEAWIVLPGTHSKHVHAKNGQIDDFQTYMTGELFQVLGQHSVLRHSVTHSAREGSDSAPLTGSGAFLEGVQAGAAAPLLRQLFRVRTRQVLHGRETGENRAFLSGLLIGAEINGLRAEVGSSRAVILCGGEHLTERYELACRSLGLGENLTIIQPGDAHRLTVLGHRLFLDRIISSQSEQNK